MGVCDSFVASGAEQDVMGEEIEQWPISQWGVTVSVKRLSHRLFWVPCFGAQFQRMLHASHG